MSNVQKEQSLRAAAEAVLRQADEAAGEYGVPVEPAEAADYMGITEFDDITGHEDD
ncbi:MAG: hypothetical protein LBV80_11515 [Deltaproteobacteria bacterium]|jgi:hypothetical protein|nr:hypothetical protein [Deltaproteobacteria bacterium]